LPCAARYFEPASHEISFGPWSALRAAQDFTRSTDCVTVRAAPLGSVDREQKPHRLNHG
jgi:hypothetical protein